MTANELAEIADGLSCEIPIKEWIDNEPKNVMNDIATMLRQQQTEIEALKKELDEQIKNTHELLGWKWKDGDYDTQLKKASEK